MQLFQIQEKCFCLVQLPNLLSVESGRQLKAQIEVLLGFPPDNLTLILDFDCTTFIDSSGIGTLVAIRKLCEAAQVELVCWSILPKVKVIFELTGLGAVFRSSPKTRSLPPGGLQPSTPQLVGYHPSVTSPLKRAIDIAGALVGLGITALIFAPIAIAIKLDSPGPIFFTQERCGLLGRPFRIWKFRSMVANAEALKTLVPNEATGAFFKNAQDPRVTRVGRFLRKTSLDEFPQFWNVLRGEMSLVGTRPPTKAELECYDIPQWQRLNVKPGITGEWQVNGRSRIRNFEEVIQLDLAYQEKWSLLYDFKILLKTLWVIFDKQEDAY